jgi:hypothetical protein
MRALGEQSVRRAAVVLEVAAPVADAEAHRRRLSGDVQAREQALEGWVVAIVEDDEAGVDVVGLVRGVDTDRVRVTPGAAVGFEHGHLVAGIQQVRRDESRDPRPHDRDPHRRRLRDGARRSMPVAL